MCGIFGIWNRDGRPVEVGRLRSATQRLRHRGPDGEGYLLVDSGTGHVQAFKGEDTPDDIDLPPIKSARGGHWDLALGHRRLSILDLSSAGHQPMASNDRRLWVVYNGEIYNYLELREELESRGHTFRSQTDTETILAAYRQWGSGCVTRFNGMWAFALVDLDQRVLVCSRDRFGIKPFHFTEAGPEFAFASEIKALVGEGGVPFNPDEGAIARFVGLGQYPSARGGETFFANVHSLPPAHTMVVSRSGRPLRRYYQIPGPPEDTPQQSAVDLVDEFRHLLFESVRLRLRSDVPVGSCLSGGLDSSSIVAAIHHLRQQLGERSPLQVTFSSVFHEEAQYNERLFVDLMLGRFPVKGVLVFPSEDDVLHHLTSVIECQDEPFGDLSIMAQWCVMRTAKEHGVGVLLDGQGADELLGGYTPFVVHVAERLARSQVCRAAHEVRSLPPGTRIRTGASAFAQLIPSPLHRALVRSLKPSPSGLRLLTSSQLDHLGTTKPIPPRAQRTSLSALLKEQIEETILPSLLRYEDRNSSAFGIEARVPFLDHRLVDFIFTTASDLRIKDGWTKWILRSAVAPYLPQRITWRRKKVGFGAPLNRWMSVASTNRYSGHGNTILDLPQAPTCGELAKRTGPRNGMGLTEVHHWRASCVALWRDSLPRGQ